MIFFPFKKHFISINIICGDNKYEIKINDLSNDSIIYLLNALALKFSKQFHFSSEIKSFRFSYSLVYCSRRWRYFIINIFSRSMY